MGPTCRLLCLVLGYLLYLFMGATIFSAIEHPIEGEMINQLQQEKTQFLQENKCVKAPALDQYVSSVISNSRRGVSLSSSQVPNWSFGQSFFFSGTVITTIGYGQQTPLSTQGKIFCMLYALIGIPLTLLLLSILVEYMMGPTNTLLAHMNAKLGHLHQPFHIRLMHLGLVTLLVFILFILLPASLLDRVEPVWNWFDSFYYCFISLTTVGLGDFIPGDNPAQAARSFYKTVVTVYLVVGLVAVMLVLRVFTSIPELDITTWFQHNTSLDEDPEKQRLQISGAMGPLYSQQVDNINKNGERRIVRARSRREDVDDYDDAEDAPVFTHQ